MLAWARSLFWDCSVLSRLSRALNEFLSARTVSGETNVVPATIPSPSARNTAIKLATWYRRLITAYRVASGFVSGTPVRG